eukprot:COSAG01_NODE_2357_length_7839_cov_6.117571_8_plen_41_part_00
MQESERNAAVPSERAKNKEQSINSTQQGPKMANNDEKCQK